MKKKIDYKELDELCRQNIEDYDNKVSIAWGYMDIMRIPFEVAAPELAQEMREELEWEGYNPEEIELLEIISA